MIFITYFDSQDTFYSYKLILFYDFQNSLIGSKLFEIAYIKGTKRYKMLDKKRVGLRRRESYVWNFVPRKLSVITSFLKLYCKAKSRPPSSQYICNLTPPSKHAFTNNHDDAMTKILLFE